MTEETEETEETEKYIENEKNRGSNVNKCNFGRIAQVKGTCWFNAIINIILLSDDIKEHLAAITQGYLREENKAKFFLSTNRVRFFEEYNIEYSNPYLTITNFNIFKEMLAYIYYLLYIEKSTTIKEINKDIAAVILNYILPNEYKSNKELLTTEYKFTEIPSNCDRLFIELYNNIHIFIKAILDNKYNLYNLYQIKINLSEIGYKTKVTNITKDNLTNKFIGCIIDIVNYTHSIKTKIMNDNKIKSAHAICGFICDGKKYIFDSSVAYRNIIKYNINSNETDLRVIECDWTNLNNITRPDNIYIRYNLLIYKKSPPSPEPSPPARAPPPFGTYFLRKILTHGPRTSRVTPVVEGGSKKKVKKISKKSKKK